jgi:membrane protein implicated in regulation of membrane protease activity
MPYYISPPPGNPLTRLIAAIIGVFVLAGAVILGTAALLVLAGLAVIAGLALWLRVAWIRRQLRKSGVDFSTATQTRTPTRTPVSDAIDAEYTVISVQENKRE